MKGEDSIPAKLVRPRLGQLHQRADLLSLLDELRTAPLTMVSGLPGAGKSALVASYVETRNIPSLWYQLDAGDEDLANFFSCLDIAVRRLIPYNKKNALPVPTPECLAADSSAISKYFSDLYHCLDAPFLMVFDRYHEVSEGAEIHRVMRDACSALPVGGRIILIASNECPPAVACLRANGSTAIIGWQELQMNPAKVKEVAALHDLTLPLEEAAKQLRRKVGVWAADLVLSLQRSSDG